MPFRLLLPRPIYDEMTAQAVTELPNECCGMLAGRFQEAGVAQVMKRYALVNSLASPDRYLSGERSLLDAHINARQNGLEFVAVYHSHPTSHPVPSRTDLAENLWQGIVHFIISLQKGQPEMRGWWLTATEFQPADWSIVGE